MFYNVSFRHGDSNLFYEFMNTLRPGSYNKKRIYKWHEDDMESTLLDIDKEEAFMLKLALPVKVTLVSED